MNAYILDSVLLGSLPSSPFSWRPAAPRGYSLFDAGGLFYLGGAPLGILRWLDAPARPDPEPPGFNYGLGDLWYSPYCGKYGFGTSKSEFPFQHVQGMHR